MHGSLSYAEKLELLQLEEEKARRIKYNKIATMFPDTGPFRRELYPRHMQFFECGKDYKKRVFLAGNRVGKTEGAGTEWSYHLTGEYPHWWKGHVFNGPIQLLCSGDTHDSTRDILQGKMLGTTDRDEKDKIGSGLIPRKNIVRVVARTHVKGAIEKAIIKTAWGGTSELWFRSYVQGREIFQGFELDGFWPDEECPEDVYDEGLVRLMTRRGISTLTFTPLNGLTPLVTKLMDGANINGMEAVTRNAAASRAIIMCGWDDVAHLDEAAKKELMAEFKPHQLKARTKGIPSLGAGAIYPVAEEDFVVKPFLIPPFWPRAYGLDVGWKKTAAVWGAQDPDSKVWYLTSEHYKGEAEPSNHATAIKARGDWIPGTIDPAAQGRSQKDGENLLDTYRKLGLVLEKANNTVESGLFNVLELLTTGQLKVFSTLQNWLSEFRVYRRDDKGHVVKENDHLMDATRYLITTGRDIATTKPHATHKERKTRDWRT